MAEISAARAAQLLREIRQGTVAEARRAEGRARATTDAVAWTSMAGFLREEVDALDLAIATLETPVLVGG